MPNVSFSSGCRFLYVWVWKKIPSSLVLHENDHVHYEDEEQTTPPDYPVPKDRSINEEHYRGSTEAIKRSVKKACRKHGLPTFTHETDNGSQQNAKQHHHQHASPPLPWKVVTRVYGRRMPNSPHYPDETIALPETDRPQLRP